MRQTDQTAESTGVLRFDHAREIERSRAQKDRDDDEADGDLITHHLRRRAKRREERIFRVRRPTGHDDAVDRKRRDGENIEHADIDVGDHPSEIHRNHGPGREREHARHQRRQQEDALVGAIRNDGLFQDELSRSAKDWNSPKGPTTLGPRRICTAAQILRSASRCRRSQSAARRAAARSRRP